MGSESTYSDGSRWWRVGRLWDLSSHLPVVSVEVSKLAYQLDEDCWCGGVGISGRDILDHTVRIMRADLTYPIILSERGHIMDGMHRLARCIMEGHRVIQVVQFETDPDPDGIDSLPF